MNNPTAALILVNELPTALIWVNDAATLTMFLICDSNDTNNVDRTATTLAAADASTPRLLFSVAAANDTAVTRRLDIL